MYKDQRWLHDGKGGGCDPIHRTPTEQVTQQGTSFEISPESSKFGDMRRRRASLSSPEDPSGRGGLSPTLAACPGTFHDRPKALAAFADAPFMPCVGSLTRGRPGRFEDALQ